MADPRIIGIDLDQKTIIRRNADIEQERRVAIFDLLEENHFAPVGHEGPFRIRDGADSYLVEDGKIRMQTIHYTVEDDRGRVLIRADGTRTTPE